MIITEALRKRIIAAWLNGTPAPQIAIKYGVSRNYVHNLARRRGHVSPTKRRIMNGWARAKANMALDTES